MAVEKVILIHGTFASSQSTQAIRDLDSEEYEDKWWQADSTFSLALAGSLSPMEIEFDRDVFVWSGENSESHRKRAAQHLYYNYIKKHEQNGTPYHLVAHSHGGNIAELALKMAVAKGQDLRCFKSWTTVGTPFLRFAPRIRVISIVLSLVAIFAVSYAAGMLWQGIGSSSQSGIQQIEPGAVMWLAIAVTVLVSVLFVLATIAALSLKTGRAIFARFVEDKAASDLADRWLGLWSKHDEAIIAIDFAKRHGRDILPTLTATDKRPPAIRPEDEGKLGEVLKESQTVQDLIGSFGLAFVNIPLHIVWFLGLKWIAFKAFAEHVQSVASGNDVRELRFKGVEVFPTCVAEPKQSISSLPDEVEKQLKLKASETFAIEGAALRSNVAYSKTNPLVDAERFAGFFGGLIHCGYFENPKIIDLIAQNIRKHSDSRIEQEE